MIRRDFRLAIVDARSRLEQVRMPAAAANRVRQNVDRALGRLRLRLVLVGLSVATAVLVAMFRTPLPSGGLAQLPEGIETVGRSADLELAVDGGGALHVRMGTCTLRVRGWGRVTIQAESWLRRVDGGLELSLGSAEFQVDKRAPGTGSTFVRGPQGTIEITGTRFTVIQRRDSGSVHLDEGGILFHAPDGRTVALVPGESLAWPLPAPLPRAAPTIPVPPPAQASVAPTARNASGGEGAIVERIAVLRAKGQYRELADELRVAMLRERRPLTRERLSFELGSVLSYHLPDVARACAHWADHHRAFPAGHYTEEVSDAEKSLRCNEEGETK